MSYSEMSPRAIGHGLSSDRKRIQPGMASMARDIADPQLCQQYHDLFLEYEWRHNPIH